MLDGTPAAVTTLDERAVTVAPAKANARRTERKRSRTSFRLFLYFTPFLLLIFLFSYYPLYGWIYAFFNYYPALGIAHSPFVGLEWFKFLVNSPTQLKQIGQVLLNTFAMSFLGIASSVLPVGFALFLNEMKAGWFKGVVQTLTTLPNFISWVLIYMIAFSMFSTTGLVNSTLKDWGFIVTPIQFLNTDSHTWLMMLAWNVWKGLGWGAILYLASITSIDPALYEAAKIDGAGRFQIMRFVTLPALTPTFFVLLMLSVANILNNGMDQYYVFQNAFNEQHIQVLDLYVYNVGIVGNSLSMAAALSMLKSLVSIVLLFGVNSLSKRVRGTSII
ncbi:ABC transporter permease [Curtobacterium ammoniigenes]|uniref:ABC transporter permease n=1 Tax=Curtobacterium ammoniigenes TaxID=395387 RepID=UPI000AA0B50A|nr:ABC transporter permease subunit [Curtobacterium ammoniigenes]